MPVLGLPKGRRTSGAGLILLDKRFRPLDQLRRHLDDPVLLRVLASVLEHLFLRRPANGVRAAALRHDPGATDHFAHWWPPPGGWRQQTYYNSRARAVKKCYRDEGRAYN